jgi:RNA polymerase sigma factor (sigma-70 family)
MERRDVPDIQELNRSIGAGGAGYWREIYQCYFPALVRFVRKRFESIPEDIAEELASRALLKLVDGERRPSFAHVSQFKAWILTTARNLALDYLRSVAGKGCTGTALSDTLDEMLVETPVCEGEGETERRVRRALAGLSPRERCLLAMRANCTPYETIAEELGVRANAARTYFFRAKARFRKLYEEEIEREIPV